jgi:hypothetical protein
MQMPADEARQRYIEYRSSVRKHREERRRQAAQEANAVHKRRTQIEREEDDLRAAYRAMALGQRVVCLPQVIRKVGFNAQGLPRLAFARSDWEWCRCNTGSATVNFRPEIFRDRGKIEFGLPVPAEARWKTGRAVVPPVPPRFRPENLGDYHTLWEAEWLPAAPEDPLLLKQIGTTMFVVVAQWDLTELERAVLEGRFA